MVTGFYVASLVKRGKPQLARQFSEGLHRANRLPMDGEEWSFPEFLHGRDHTPGGTRHMGWSAAAAIIAEQTQLGKPLFPETP